jgi:acetylglutamate kinase
LQHQIILLKLSKIYNQLKVFKIGGGIIDDKVALEKFLLDFAQVDSPKILVHGGGRGANVQLAKMGIEPKMVEGRRVTDEQTLEVVTGFYAGVTNKEIVAGLQKLGVNALGISGPDGNAIQGVKRPVKTIDYGFVGDITDDSVNISLFELLLENGIVPVVCAITHDGNGQLLNTNADTIASTLAVALANVYEVDLHFCFDKNGVLTDINDDQSYIPVIDFESYQQLKADNIVADGMIPKLDNAFSVIEKGVKKVYIQHASNINSEIGTILK